MSVTLAPALTTAPATVTVVSGPMFAGKTTFLVAARDAASSTPPAALFATHTLDTRVSVGVGTHNGAVCSAVRVASLTELDETVNMAGLVVGGLILVDELQLFDRSILGLRVWALGRGFTVLAAGLDYDYRRQPFGPTLELAEHADTHIRLTARCVDGCLRPARYTQRLSSERELVVIGGAGKYAPRCHLHHTIPGGC